MRPSDGWFLEGALSKLKSFSIVSFWATRRISVTFTLCIQILHYAQDDIAFSLRVQSETCWRFSKTRRRIFYLRRRIGCRMWTTFQQDLHKSPVKHSKIIKCELANLLTLKASALTPHCMDISPEFWEFGKKIFGFQSNEGCVWLISAMFLPLGFIKIWLLSILKGNL